MSLNIKGTISKILKMESGTSKAGREWKKQGFVVDTQEQFSKQICFTLLNDKISLLNGISEGDEVTVSFSVESREFNGKWYTDASAWKIEQTNTGAPADAPPPFSIDDMPPEPASGENDLPF